MSPISLIKSIRVPQLAVRGIQLFCAVVILGLSAYVANWYNTDTLTSSPTQINIMIFSAVWSIFSIVQMELIPRFLPRLANPYAFIGIEFINVVLWFASGVSLSVFLSKLLFCRGSICAAAQADAVFAFVMLLAWGGSFVSLALDLFKGGLRKPAASRSATGAMKEVA